MIRYRDLEICNEKRTISRNGKTIKFARPYRRAKSNITFKTMTHLLLCGDLGLSRTQLFDLTYGHSRDGGPEEGEHIFDIWLCIWRRRGFFKKLNCAPIHEKRGGVMYYHLALL